VRKSLLIGVLFTLGSLLFFQAAWAHMSDLGPHNENGNVWMDLYRHQDFNGNLRAAAHNFSEEETGGLNEAPYPRIVSLFDAADLEVVRQPCVDDGNSESFFMHRKNGPDLVSMGNCVEYPKWILTHEIKHGYGGQHIENCAEVIEPDPRYLPEIRRSVMCAKRWNSGDLTRHDKDDLRNIPNQRQETGTFFAQSVPENTESIVPPQAHKVPPSDGDWIIYEDFKTKIPAKKAD
jgi:hypothetical protein